MRSLVELVEHARKNPIIDEERRQQRISFAYGTLALSVPNATRKEVQKAAERIDDRPGK